MRSQTTEAFRKRFRQLPIDVQRDALKVYRLWKQNPYHASFQFKEIEITQNKSLWSVRTKLGYRTLGTRPEPDLLVWHWIGPHADYDKLLTAAELKSSSELEACKTSCHTRQGVFASKFSCRENSAKS